MSLCIWYKKRYKGLPLYLFMAKLNADLLDDLTIKAAKYGDKPNPLRDGRGLFLLHENGSKYF